MRRRNGFTLLEMIVATLIMAIAVVTMLSGISTSMRNAARLAEYDRVVQLARLQMNELLVDYRLPRDVAVGGPFDPAMAGGLQAGWQARLSNFEMPPAPQPGDLALDRIELQVWWMAGPLRRTFALDAYRRRILSPHDLSPGAGQ